MTATAVLADPARGGRLNDVGGDRIARLERVRAALRKAEVATGVQPVDWSNAAPSPPREPDLTRAPGVEGELTGRVRRGERPESAGRGSERGAAAMEGIWLPVPAAFAPLLPHGAVRSGSVIEVTGSTAVLLHLIAALAGREAWSVVVARPDLGLAAALAAGVDPERLVLVPEPGAGAGQVLGALVDGFDVVVSGDCPALSGRERRALAQRVRHRGAVLISSTPWPEAALRLSASVRSSDGFEVRGRAESVGVVVDAVSRGDDRRRRAVIHLTPDGPSRVWGADRETPGPGSYAAADLVREAG